MFSVVVEIIWVFFSKSISVRWSQISLEQNVNEIYRSDEIEFPIISANGYSEDRSTTNYSQIGDIRLFIFYWLEWLSMFSLLFYWSEERGSSEILITDWRNWGSTQQISSFAFSQDASGCSFFFFFFFIIKRFEPYPRGLTCGTCWISHLNNLRSKVLSEEISWSSCHQRVKRFVIN